MSFSIIVEIITYVAMVGVFQFIICIPISILGLSLTPWDVNYKQLFGNIINPLVAAVEIFLWIPLIIYLFLSIFFEFGESGILRLFQFVIKLVSVGLAMWIVDMII